MRHNDLQVSKSNVVGAVDKSSCATRVNRRGWSTLGQGSSAICRQLKNALRDRLYSFSPLSAPDVPARSIKDFSSFDRTSYALKVRQGD